MGKDILFAAGGIGLAPLRSVINQVLDERGKYGRVTVFYGARTPADLLFTYELSAWTYRDDIDLRVTVDRCDETWQGSIGLITTLFPQIDVYGRNTIAIVVGPPVMCRFVLIELPAKGLPRATSGSVWNGGCAAG